LDDLLSISECFDVVLAGALVEHLGDPVSAIGGMCRVARETVVLAFTPLDETPGEQMRPCTEWTAEHNYTWWAISRDLYRKIFSLFGYDVQFHECSAFYVPLGARVSRMTMVAHKRAS
jgi:O-methyltransferase